MLSGTSLPGFTMCPSYIRQLSSVICVAKLFSSWFTEERLPEKDLPLATFLPPLVARAVLYLLALFSQ